MAFNYKYLFHNNTKIISKAQVEVCCEKMSYYWFGNEEDGVGVIKPFFIREEPSVGETTPGDIIEVKIKFHNEIIQKCPDCGEALNIEEL